MSLGGGYHGGGDLIRRLSFRRHTAVKAVSDVFTASAGRRLCGLAVTDTCRSLPHMRQACRRRKGCGGSCIAAAFV
jgi:hypothetical protein